MACELRRLKEGSATCYTSRSQGREWEPVGIEHFRSILGAVTAPSAWRPSPRLIILDLQFIATLPVCALL